MQLRRSLGLICAGALVLAYATGASALSLKPFEEVETQLVSSQPLQYGKPFGDSGPTVLIPVTSTPLLCRNTSAPSPFTSPISPLYSRSGDFQKPFVFGAAQATPTISAAAYGSTLKYSGATIELLGDPALVCYGLDANGVHSPTPGVLRDQFEGVNYSPTFKKSFNSSVVLTVVHLPTSPTDFYSYTVDVTIPAKPDAGCGSTVDCNFALLEGFDSSVFSTNAGGWCLANAGATSCPGTPRLGGININYSNYDTNQVNLAAGAATATYHFVVIRYFASGVNALPQTDKAVAIAALFSPFDLDENFIGDNVAAGYTNTAPAVVQNDATWSTFSAGLSALSENTDSGTLSFNVSDADTAGGLTTTVTLTLGSLSVPVSPNCNSINLAGAASAAQCSFALPLSNGRWWDSSVDAVYRGAGNAFATDPGGVNAVANISVKDALGKSSASVSVPIHVASKVNNAPEVAFGAAMPNVSDPNQGGAAFPTYSCSIAANNCGATFHVVHLADVISAQPGPAAALDELAAQTVDVNDVTCGESGENDAIFQNAPVAEAGGSAGSFDLLFQLKSTLVAGSSLCTAVITDKAAAYPGGQVAATTSKQFRIVVSP